MGSASPPPSRLRVSPPLLSWVAASRRRGLLHADSAIRLRTRVYRLASRVPVTTTTQHDAGHPPVEHASKSWWVSTELLLRPPIADVLALNNQCSGQNVVRCLSDNGLRVRFVLRPEGQDGVLVRFPGQPDRTQGNPEAVS